MDDQGEVVIRDPQGTEHVFPAGFDPMKAAAIVRGGSSDAHPIAANEPDTYAGGFLKSLKDQFSHAVKPVSAEDTAAGLWQGKTVPDALAKTMSTPIVHPTGVDAIDSFVSPAGLIGLGGAAAVGLAGSPAARGVTGKALNVVGDFNFKKPFKSTIGKVADALERSAQPKPTAAPPPVPVEAPPPAPLSDLEFAKAEVAAGRQPPGIIAALERAQQAPQKAPPGMIRGSLRPLVVSPESAMQPESPMQAPRVNVGAEVVGRQNGLTKEAVRQQTAPILGEQPGEASPILPQQALGKIIDAVKALPPGGPEREAYVARATSGKAQWQIENVRRTLEHLGLIVPLAAAPAMVSGRLRQMPSQEQE